jgi:RNA-binding protein (KH domain)
MEALVEYIVKALVSQPDQVNISRVERDDATVIEVRVAPEDMGKIIGKQGRIARAMRTVVKAASAKEAKRVIVDIL